MKKIIPILVVSILIIGGIGASATQFLEKKVTSLSNPDELDQYQDVMTENAFLPIGQILMPDFILNVQGAQSFIPTKKMLTRVELFVIKNITATYPLVISIREELTEDDLTTANIDPAQVPSADFDWIEVDLDDIVVTPGQTYYLVAITENTTENYYGWGANNISESYPYGCMWYSIDDGFTWGNESVSNPCNADSVANQGGQTDFDDPVTWDMCFRTYGTDNLPPETPEIDGQTSGTAGVEYTYTFSTTDPDDDDVYYWILWGDDCPAVEWIGPYASGEEVSVAHTYSERGTYTITAKAKDIYDAESDWGSLEVTMPRARAVNNLLVRFLQNYPNLFPILRQLLGL